MPDSYYPLPLIKINGIFKYFGQIGGYISMVYLLSTTGLSLVAVGESCVARLALIYELRVIQTFLKGPRLILSIVKGKINILDL